MIDKHAMIGIPIPVQVEMVCLVNHGHGVGVVVILRIIQPTMAAFAANTIGQTTAVLLRDGAKTIPMCATASCIIARRERRVERTDGVEEHIPRLRQLPPQLIAEAMAGLVVPAIRVILALRARVEHARYRLYGALLLQTHG